MSDQLQGERRKLTARYEALMTLSWRLTQQRRISIVRTMSQAIKNTDKFESIIKSNLSVFLMVITMSYSSELLIYVDSVYW